MSGEDPKTVDPDTDDLEAFEELFSGEAKVTEQSETPDDEPQLDEQDPVATEDEEAENSEPSDEDETPDEDHPDEDDEGGNTDEETYEEGDPKPQKKKKNSAQERIEELNARWREEERLRQELEQRLQELEKQREAPAEEAETAEETGPPNPDKVDANGEPVYPLGDLDPDYIRDLTRYTLEEERSALREELKQEREMERQQEQQQRLAQQWEEKVAILEEDIPDLRDKGSQFAEALERADPQYTEYVASTLLSLENGPAVVAYLADNPAELQKLVASDPRGATLTLGRIDAIVSTPKEKPKPKSRPSSAPEPPKHTTRGTDGRFSTAPDTDDLDAFENLYFNNTKK